MSSNTSTPPRRNNRRARYIREGYRSADRYISRWGGIQLRPYQIEPIGRILESIQNHLGDTIVLVFPRQSGKDELLIQLKTYLLDMYAPLPVGIVEVNPTYQPQTINARMRFDRCLRLNRMTQKRWKKAGEFMRQIQLATASFLSGDGEANTVGATANLLLIINEAQDISPSVYAQKFEPMTSSTNATRLICGTVWTSTTFLAREMRAAGEAERRDGRKRVFLADADTVRKHAAWYGQHVDGVIARLGRQHPLVRTQYFNEEIDAQAGMFNAGRMALMQGDPSPADPAIRGSGAGRIHAFCIDVAGQDEAVGGTLRGELPLREGMGNPGRDSTTLSIVEVDLSTVETLQAPTYRVVRRAAWQGMNHLAVFGQIKSLAEAWQPQHIVIDATGVGEGLWAMLDRAFPRRVTPVKFSQQVKSEIGWGFLSIIETGRFRDCSGRAGIREAPASPTSAPHGAEAQVNPDTVRLQYQSCQSEILPGPLKTLRWGVPDGTRSPDGQLIHDDHVMADALVALLDKLSWSIRSPALLVHPRDPLPDMDGNY